MKTRVLLCLALLCGFGILFLNMDYMPYGGYRPVFMEREELEKSVSYQTESREMKRPGKIYYRNPYIFVSEKYKGVHIINNSNPKQPKQEGFIVAPGCLDMAVKGNILYIDNAVDLVSFDLETKKVTGRVKNVFPEPMAPDNMYYPATGRPENFIIVDWKRNY